MPAFTVKHYEQILQNMISIVVSRTDLSDLTDASVHKHILAATAREIDEAYYQMVRLQDIFSIDTARGDDLDARAAEIQPALITRRQATIATGNVVFSRSGTSGTVNIPAGVVVKTADGIAFETTATAQILDTQTDSGNVPAIAQVAGVSGNVPASTILKFDSVPVGVETVDNPANFTGGEDRESDDDFRDRLKDFIASLPRCTSQALEFGAEQVVLASGQRVKFAHAVEDLNNRGEVYLYIDDGTGTAETNTAVTDELVTEGLGGAANVGPPIFPAGDTAIGGEERLYLNNVPVKDTQPFILVSTDRGTLTDGVEYTYDPTSGLIVFNPALVADEGISVSYTHYTGLIQEVQKVIDGDENDRENYPGWRAAGVRVWVLTPAVLVQSVDANLTISEGFATSEVINDVEDAILDYINNLGISGDVVRARIIEIIMSVSGVYNVNLVAPAADVIILDDQLPRTTLGNLNIT